MRFGEGKMALEAPMLALAALAALARDRLSVGSGPGTLWDGSFGQVGESETVVPRQPLGRRGRDLLVVPLQRHQ